MSITSDSKICICYTYIVSRLNACLMHILTIKNMHCLCIICTVEEGGADGTVEEGGCPTPPWKKVGADGSTLMW